ncbi:hypothetical protein [Mariniluteicoccus flavus]
MTNQGGWPGQGNGGQGGWSGPGNQGNQGPSGWPNYPGGQPPQQPGGWGEPNPGPYAGPGQSGPGQSGGWPQQGPGPQPPQQEGWQQQPGPGGWPQGGGPQGPGGPRGPHGPGPTGPGGPRKSSGGLGPALVIGIGVLVLALVGGLSWFLLRPSGGGGVAATPAPTTVRPTAQPTRTAAPTATPTASASSSQSSSCPMTPVPAQVAGWQAIASTRDRAAFDVPADWSNSPEIVWGQEGENNEMIIAHCGGVYMQGFCENKKMSDRARVGFITFGSKANPEGDALAVAKMWTRLAQYDYKTKTQHPVPEPAVSTVKVNNGATDAQVATATWDVGSPGTDCPSPKARLTVASIPLDANRKATLVIATDVGVDKEVSQDLERQILGSLRPL